MAVKGQHLGSGGDAGVLHGDCQCQNSGCESVLPFCRMFPLQKTRRDQY
jgi:hypothetical protein